MATTSQILKVTTATWKTVAIEGVVEASYQHVVIPRTGRIDGALGPTNIDAVNERLTGTLLIANEAPDLFYLDGSVGVLVLNYKEDETAADKTLTIGLVGELTGVMFNGSDLTVGLGVDGQSPITTLTWRAIYHANSKFTFGGTLGGAGDDAGIAIFS